MRLACVHQPHSSLYCSGARFLSAVLMLAEKSEPDKGAPAPSHQARTSISLGSPWNTESGWKWPSEPLTRTEHLAQVLQTRGGSMLLAVRVPQDHVKPRTERCGGQRSQRGAQSEPLCCSHEAAARAGQSVLKDLRSANEHLGGKPYGALPMEPGVVLQPVGLPGKRRSTGKVCVPGLCAGERALLSVSGSQASSLGRQCPLHFRVQRCWRLLRFRTPPPPVRKGPIGRSTPCV